MNIACGLIGLPNVGKSTLFNAITKSNILAANYPFATIEPNTGVVPIPDDRLTKLSKLYHDAPIVPATVTFVDIAGLVAGASQGEGLGNQFLSHIRSTNAIIHVVRAFTDENVIHVDQTINPHKDIETINTELVLADLQTVTKRLPKIEKEAKANPKLQSVLQNYQRIYQNLNDDVPLWKAKDIATEDVRDLQLLTLKPVIFVFNIDEGKLTDTGFQSQLSALVAPSQAIFICAKLESELQDLNDHDANELLQSYGQSEPGLHQLIKAAYTSLGLQSFLTAGDKEVRAWTIPVGSSAPQAAGVIHGDFERGFIAAEIVSYQDLVTAGSLNLARSNGKVRTEGKNYIMQLDDVVEFRFNVSK